MNWNVEVKNPAGGVFTAGLPSDKTPKWYMQQVGPHGYVLLRAFFVDDKGRTVWSTNEAVDAFPTAAMFNALLDPPSSLQQTTTQANDSNIPPPQPVRIGRPGSTPRTVATLAELDEALHQGWAPIRSNGTLMITQRFTAPGDAGAGWLADGHPLNVILGQGWIAGQKEILDAAIAAGQVPEPYLMLDAPELVLDGGLAGWLPIAGAVAAGLVLLPRLLKRRK